MKLTSTGTPIPKRDIGAKARGSGPVITYRLSPEELERVRRGERLERKEEQNVATTTAPDKAEVLRRLAAGKSVSKIETEMGLGKGVLHYWIDKWGLKGVKGEQAQRMLDELLIDQRAEYVPVDPKPLKSSELVQEQVNVRAVALAGQAAEKQFVEIEQLKKELAEKTARIAELEQTVTRLEEDKKYWMGEAEILNVEAEKYREERDALLQTVERAVDQDKPSRIDIMRVIEEAVLGLSGIEAYYTGAAIEHLWRWQTVEDLRRARHHIDRLVETVVVEGAG